MPTESLAHSQAQPMPPQAAMIFGLIWFLIMGAISVSYLFMVISLWKGMRAHQKIAEKLGEIADRLSPK